MDSNPSLLRVIHIHRIGQHLREHSRHLMRAAQRIAQVSEVVADDSTATTTHMERASESVMLPASGTVEALHAEIARLRAENADLRASALLWADLYERGVTRTNVLEDDLSVVGSTRSAMADNPDAPRPRALSSGCQPAEPCQPQSIASSSVSARHI